MRLVWTTDPHLNHTAESVRQEWFQQLASRGANGIVISGDLSEGDDVVFCLQQMAKTLSLPIYFVLGNHDFYGTSIAHTRRQVIDVCRQHSQLHYLTDESPTELSENVFLIGEDGWGDATEGDYENSMVRLNDFRLIDDFRLTTADQWKGMLIELGAASAERLTSKLQSISPKAKQIVVVTHVPPFCEACWYEGKTTDENWSPFFVCGQIGKVLLEFCQTRPACEVVVLCGHTHHGGVAKMMPNLIVHTGAATYRHPDMEAIVSIGDKIQVQSFSC